MLKFMVIVLAISAQCFLCLAKAESTSIAINDIRFKEEILSQPKELQYALSTVKTSNKQSRPYGSFALSWQKKGSSLALRDRMTILKTPSQEKLVFQRVIELNRDSVCSPKEITVEVLGTSSKRSQPFQYKDGVIAIADWEGNRKENCRLEEGFFSFPMAFMILPLLPAKEDEFYSIRWFLEPCSFLRKANSPDDFILTCSGKDKLTFNKKDIACIRYLLNLKSIDSQITFWISTDSKKIVKFEQSLPDNEMLVGMLENSH